MEACINLERQMPKQDEKAKERKTIVFVDDERLLHNVFSRLFERRGYKVLCFYSAAKMIEEFKDWEKKKPDLVVVDYMMPYMDGLELVEWIRRRDQMTPVIMITAHGSIQLAVRALNMGVDDFIPKPFSTTELLERVEALMKLGYAKGQNDELLYARLKRQNRELLQLVNLLSTQSNRVKLEPRLSEGKLDTYRAFLGATAHTLKGEFSHMGLAVNMIEDWPDLPDDVREECEVIKRSLSYSSILLRRLLDYLEMGSPAKESATVADLIGKIELLARPRIPSDVELVIDVQSTVELSIIETNLEQVLGVVLELIKNASRALGEEGGRIDVNVNVEDDNVVLSVKDNGPGIPEELRDVILKEQVPSERGMGLGLHLSSKVIEALGGTLSLESTSSEGTVFSISLPLSNSQEDD